MEAAELSDSQKIQQKVGKEEKKGDIKKNS